MEEMRKIAYDDIFGSNKELKDRIERIWKLERYTSYTALAKAVGVANKHRFCDFLRNDNINISTPVKLQILQWVEQKEEEHGLK